MLQANEEKTSSPLRYAHPNTGILRQLLTAPYALDLKSNLRLEPIINGSRWTHHLTPIQ
jgi:hypothetical protein